MMATSRSPGVICVSESVPPPRVWQPDGDIIAAEGFRSGSLHHFLDTELVVRLGADPRLLGAAIMADITPEQRRAWSQGTTVDWTMECFALARDHAYRLRTGRGRSLRAEIPGMLIS